MSCCYYLFFESHLNKRLNRDQFFSDQDVKEANMIYNLNKSFRTKHSLTQHNGSHMWQFHLCLQSGGTAHCNGFSLPLSSQLPQSTEEWASS